MKTVLFMFALAFLLALEFSCKENPVRPASKGNPPTNDEYALIPLFIGNTWAYADSVLVDSTLLNRALVVYNITDFSIESGHTWWTQSFSGVSMDYSVTNDSVYHRQYTDSPAVLDFVPPPALGDTLRYLRTLPDLPTDTITVFRMGSPFISQCGTFDSVVVYEVRTFYRHFTTYIKPQIGILRSEVFSDAYGRVAEKQDIVYYRLSY